MKFKNLTTGGKKGISLSFDEKDFWRIFILARYRNYFTKTYLQKLCQKFVELEKLFWTYELIFQFEILE